MWQRGLTRSCATPPRSQGSALVRLQASFGRAEGERRPLRWPGRAAQGQALVRHPLVARAPESLPRGHLPCLPRRDGDRRRPGSARIVDRGAGRARGWLPGSHRVPPPGHASVETSEEAAGGPCSSASSRSRGDESSPVGAPILGVSPRESRRVDGRRPRPPAVCEPGTSGRSMTPDAPSRQRGRGAPGTSAPTYAPPGPDGESGPTTAAQALRRARDTPPTRPSAPIPSRLRLLGSGTLGEFGAKAM